ncbi:MAG: TIR domain-containing protein [Pirellulales bacterium]
MPHVFVSHASQDHDVIYARIVQLLNEHGLTTFYSRDSILGAQEWEKRIREGLEDCPWFLVALSPNSVKSEWVQAEVGWALVNRRGRLIPVLVGDCRPEDCNLRLCQIQYVDLRADHPEARKALIDILQNSGTEPDGSGSVEWDERSDAHGRAPVRGTPSSTRKWIWPGVAGAVLGAGLGAWWLWPVPDRVAGPDAPTVPQTDSGSPLSGTGNPTTVGSASTSAPPPVNPLVSPPASPSVTIALGLDQETVVPEPEAINVEGHAEVDPFALRYDYAMRDSVLVVRYTMPYLETIRRGEVVRGVKPRPFNWYFPKLSVKTLNNSPQTVLLTECVLEVTESSVIQDPLITVADGSFNFLIFLNDGWGPVIDPVVTFKFGASSSEEDSSSAVERHTLELKTFDDVARIPMGRYLPAELEGAASVDVSGVLEYGAAGARQSLKFTTSVNLESYPGDPSPPTREYDVMLIAGEAPKTIRRPIAQEIKSTESDQFLLRMGSDKSGRYLVTVKFLGVDGQVVAERKLELEVFVPRMASKHVKSAVGSAAESANAESTAP